MKLELKKIAMGFVLYNPSPNNIDTIKKYFSMRFIDCFYVFDNSNQCNELINSDNVSYNWNGDNLGLSIPYNTMIETCIEKEIDYLCLMDQDSDFPIDEIENLVEFISSDKNLDQYAIIAPRSYLPNRIHKDRNKKITNVEYAINSGSFLNLKTFKAYDLRYDPYIFLDGVDFEMGMQIREKGLMVGIYEDSVFVQNIGYLSSEDDLFVKHSPERYKYISHNRKYIYKKHFGLIRGGIIAFVKNIRLIGLVILYEDDKAAKTKAILSEIL